MPPTPPNYSGGRCSSSKFDGGLKSKHGGSMGRGGELKMLSKIPVKEFYSKVAGYKPASLQIY